MAKIDTAAMIALLGRLDGLADRITREHNTEIPAERINAKGDSDLLARLDSRAGDLKVASKMHADAKAAFMAAKAAFKTDPEALETQYAEASKLAAQIEAVLDYRRKPGDVKDTKVDTTSTDAADKDSGKGKTDDKSGKPKADDKPADTADDGKEKGKGDKGDKPADPKSDGKDKTDDKSDPVLAAIQKLTESCGQNHKAAMDAITALEPRLIKPELAKIINGRTPEQLAAALNGHGVTPQQAAFLEALVARFTPDEFIALLDVRNAGYLERFRFAFGGNGNAQSTPNGGSHR